MIAVILLCVALVVFYIACWWIIFQKANRPGWAILVPIYNIVVQFQVAKVSPWLILLYLLAIIPIVGPFIALILNIIVTVKLCTAFGKGTGFILGMIFLGFIFVPILAFGKSQYQFDNCDCDCICE